LPAGQAFSVLIGVFGRASCLNRVEIDRDGDLAAPQHEQVCRRAAYGIGSERIAGLRGWPVARVRSEFGLYVLGLMDAHGALDGPLQLRKLVRQD
jgi:hypothetical protein